MIVPNKFTTLDRSLLAKGPKILETLKEALSLEELYTKLAASFEDPGEFVLAMDVLFVLGRIEIDANRKVVVSC